MQETDECLNQPGGPSFHFIHIFYHHSTFNVSLKASRNPTWNKSACIIVGCNMCKFID